MGESAVAVMVVAVVVVAAEKKLWANNHKLPGQVTWGVLHAPWENRTTTPSLAAQRTPPAHHACLAIQEPTSHIYPHATAAQ